MDLVVRVGARMVLVVRLRAKLVQMVRVGPIEGIKW
jgi:hypothetical protein